MSLTLSHLFSYKMLVIELNTYADRTSRLNG
jgi:hypothetical protein